MTWASFCRSLMDQKKTNMPKPKSKRKNCKGPCSPVNVAFKTCTGVPVKFKAKVKRSPKNKKELEERLKKVPLPLRENARDWFFNGGPSERPPSRRCSKKRKTPTTSGPAPKKRKTPTSRPTRKRKSPGRLIEQM